VDDQESAPNCLSAQPMDRRRIRNGMNVNLMRCCGAICLIGLAAWSAPALASCPPGALGVSRTLHLSTRGGFKVGLKTYPETLALADREVVLTFDDGPANGTTAKVLDALAAECVKATFFLLGRNAQALPELAKREVAEGHTVGHHSFSHPYETLRRVGEAAAKLDIDRGFAADDKAAYGDAGSAPRVRFFRFPGFADTPQLNAWLAGRDIAIFGTDVWASDWMPLTPAKELDLVLSRLEQSKGGILLLHDTKPQTAAMLPDLLLELKRRGFHIVHMAPGEDQPELRRAPADWTSETERIIAEVFARRTGPKSGGGAQAPAEPQAEPAPASPKP
jgi:peptidoglycan/xylan/chitin deacetylase (PgdA/CDA1 family)